ncbi:outer membrane beta-barrel protein [Vibrio vulnificus]
MNKMLPILALAMGTAFHVNATETEQPQLGPKQGWYLGLDAVKAEVSFNDVGSQSYDLDVGAVFTVGYDKKFTNNFVTGFEFEYAYFGSKKMGETLSNSNVGQVMTDIEVAFSAFGFNMRPKYYFGDSKFYLGGLLGYASTKQEWLRTRDNFQSATDKESSGSGFNYGVEVGYEFDSGWMLQGGYRGVATDFDDVNVDISALYIGGRYKF